jgi:hypothetical protein
MDIQTCTRPRFAVAFGFALLVAFVAPAFAFTYTYPLSSTDIRDAYFIGRRNDEVTSDFLLKYTRHFDKPSSGAYIADIAIATPFTQIVTYSSQTANYDAPSAVQQFQDKPMKFFAHVFIFVANDYKIQQTDSSNSIYPSYRPFWQDFKIEVAQRQTIHPISVNGEFLYSSDSNVASGGANVGAASYGPVGARVGLEYSADKIDSDLTTISVDAPDGQHVEATFDLTSLR